MTGKERLAVALASFGVLLTFAALWTIRPSLGIAAAGLYLCWVARRMAQ